MAIFGLAPIEAWLFSKTDQQGRIVSRPWIRTFTTKDGLADDRVTAIAQDREGHLWFGTSGGASRYDGQTVNIRLTRGFES